jgi:hypothetical protein
MERCETVKQKTKVGLVILTSCCRYKVSVAERGVQACSYLLDLGVSRKTSAPMPSNGREFDGGVRGADAGRAAAGRSCSIQVVRYAIRAESRRIVRNIVASDREDRLSHYSRVQMAFLVIIVPGHFPIPP